MREQKNTLLWVVATIMLAALIWSAFGPNEFDVWVFEIVPGTLATAVFIVTFNRFRFSNLIYILLCGQFLLLATGAKYTYAEVPLFNWIRDTWDLSRNHFDRVGHFAQGFAPAILFRELLLRLSSMRKGALLFFVVVSICLAFSALYEIIEVFVVLLFYPDSGPAWLGHQGDPYDAQWDMALAAIGATVSLLLLGRIHDRSMERVIERRARISEGR